MIIFQWKNSFIKYKTSLAHKTHFSFFIFHFSLLISFFFLYFFFPFSPFLFSLLFIFTLINLSPSPSLVTSSPPLLSSPDPSPPQSSAASPPLGEQRGDTAHGTSDLPPPSHLLLYRLPS